MNLAPPRGTRDFFPEDMRLRTWLFGHFHAVARTFAFEEVDAPVLETEELYIRKAGEEITHQLFNFEDKGGRRVTLRPEMTPSLARMLLQRAGSLPMPARWYSIPQCWRYERMTRGRRREHFQWNMDIFGVAGVAAEAELLACVVATLGRLGLSASDVVIRVNNRKALQAMMALLGVSEHDFAPVCVVVDKRDKLSTEELLTQLGALGFPEDGARRMLDALEVPTLDALALTLGPDHEAVRELRELFALAEAYGYADWLRFDATLVRGLAYYTGVVFEAFPREGTLRAICGGGRYDRLLSTFGGQDVPACGFGFGDAVIVELLKDKGLLPSPADAVDDVVFAWSADLQPAAARVASLLRAAGRSVDLVLEDKRARWAFKHADRRHADRVLMVAPDEWARGLVHVKDLATGAEQDLPLTALIP